MLIPLRSSLKKVENSDKKRVAILGYSGTAVDVSDVQPAIHEPLVYNLNGFSVANNIPYYREHSVLIGHTIENKKIEGQLVTIAEHSVDNEDSITVYNGISQGENYEASMGVEVDVSEITYIAEGTVEINNRIFQAPLFVANKGVVTEMTATKSGRDGNTSIHKLSKFDEAKEQLMKIKNSTTASPPEKKEEDVKVENATTKTTEKDGKSKQGGVTDTTIDKAEDKKEASKEAPKKVTNSAPTSSPLDYLWDYVNDNEAKVLIPNARKEGWDEDRFKREVEIASIQNSYKHIPNVTIVDNKIENSFQARLAKSLGISSEMIAEKLGKKAADYADSQGFMGLKEGLMYCANANGGRFNGHSDERNLAKFVKRMVIQNSFSTIDYPNLMHQITGWKLEAAWELDTPQAPSMCKEISSKDFKKTGHIKPRGGKMWEGFNQEGKINHGSFGKEDTYETELNTIAQIVTFKREDIINDDIGWIEETLNLMLEGALMVPDYQMVNLIMAAETNGVLVTSGAGQSKFTLALTEANLTTVYNALRRRYTTKGAATGDKTVNGRFNTRWTLVVPVGLEQTAWDILKQDRIVNDTTANTKTGDKNYWFNRLDLMVFDNLDNTSYHASAAADNWLILPQRDTYRPFYINYLNGQKRPTTETIDLPADELGFGVRGYWDVNLGYRPVENNKLQAYAFSDPA